MFRQVEMQRPDIGLELRTKRIGIGRQRAGQQQSGVQKQMSAEEAALAGQSPHLRSYLANGPLPPGRHYLACVLQDDDLDEMGTNPLEVSFVFQAIRVPVVTPTGLNAGIGWRLYDTNMTSLPALN